MIGCFSCQRLKFYGSYLPDSDICHLSLLNEVLNEVKLHNELTRQRLLPPG